MCVKRFFGCMVLAITAVVANGQEDSSGKPPKPYKPREYQQEIRLGAGGYTLPFLAEQFFSKQKKDKQYIVSAPESAGAYSFGFAGFVKDGWNVGITLALENITASAGRRVYDSVAYDTLFVKTDYRVKAITLIPTVTKYWKQSKMLNLYSGLGLGLSFISADQTGNVDLDRTEDTQIGISLQLIPIGVRVGNKYAGFAELGFGNLGLLRIGFSAGF